MMSILFKGVEMPKGCWDCPFQTNPICATNDILNFATRIARPDNCPLIEVPEWIPVTDRLPDSSDEYVLCCGSKGGMFVGWAAIKTYDGSGKCTGFQNSGKGRNFTHWMPLPEPPKEET